MNHTEPQPQLSEPSSNPVLSQVGLIGVLVATVFLTRWASGIGLSWSGFWADTATFFAFYALFNVMFLWGRSARFVMGLGLALVQVVFFCFVLYYRFFHSFPGVSTFSALSQLGTAYGSIPALFKRSDLIWGLLLLSIWPVMRFFPKKSTLDTVLVKSLGAMFVATGTLLGAQALQAKAFISAQHNPFLYLAQTLFQSEVTMPAVAANPGSTGNVLNQTATYLHRLYPEYQPVNMAKYPVYRFPTDGPQKAKKPMNVVIVFMESYRALEGGLSHLPQPSVPEVGSEIKKLAQTGWFFPQFYANAHQTVRAELNMLCSLYSPMMTKALVYLGNPKLKARCLPEVLADAGYQTSWISSFDSKFSNKQLFLKHHGVQHFIDQKHMDKWPKKHPMIGWGASDLDLMDLSIHHLNAMKEPFFAEIMTLTNHHPFGRDHDIPQDHIAIPPDNPVYGRYLRGMHFTDYALGQFMKAAQKQPWFQNTLFVLMGDHGVWSFPTAPALSDIHKTEIFHRTGLVLWSPSLKPRVFENRVGSQVDLAPTLLDFLGIRSPNGFMGSSLLNEAIPDQERFAVMRNETAWHVRRGNQYCYSSGYSCFEDSFPYCEEGEKPRETGFTCFETDKDLLSLHQDATTLSPQNENALLSFGFNMLKLNQTLLQNNNYVPGHNTKRAP